MITFEYTGDDDQDLFPGDLISFSSSYAAWRYLIIADHGCGSRGLDLMALACSPEAFRGVGLLSTLPNKNDLKKHIVEGYYRLFVVRNTDT
jgi:hypothetical protein